MGIARFLPLLAITFLSLSCSNNAPGGSFLYEDYQEYGKVAPLGFKLGMPDYRNDWSKEEGVSSYWTYSKPNIPTILSKGRDNYEKKGDLSLSTPPSVEKPRSFSLPDHLPTLPEITLVTDEGGNRTYSLGNYAGYEVMANESRSGYRGFFNGNHCEDAISHFGPYMIDGFLDSMRPFLVKDGKTQFVNDSPLTVPFYKLYLDGSIGEEDIGRMFYSILSFEIDRGSLFPGWRKDNVSEWEGEFLSWWKKKLNKGCYEDYAFRSKEGYEPLLPTTYRSVGRGNDFSNLINCPYYDHLGHRLEVLPTGSGYTELLRLGRGSVFAWRQYSYRDYPGINRETEGRACGYSSFFGHRYYFGLFPATHIWFYDGSQCEDILYAYSQGKLRDGDIRAIAQASYAYCLDHCASESNMKEYFEEMEIKNYVAPSKCSLYDSAADAEYIAPYLY